MSVRLKLLVLVSFVALVPLTVSAWMALRVHQRALDGKVDELHRKSAEHGAAVALALLRDGRRGPELMVRETVRWADLSAEERAGALWLVYQQHDDIAAVALLDETARPLASASVGPGPVADGSSRHPAAGPEMVAALAAHAPRGVLGAELGAPYLAPDGAAILLPLGFAVRGPGDAQWRVAIALSLRTLCADLARAVADQAELSLADGAGRIVCPPGRGALPPADAALGAILAGRASRQFSYRDAGGRDLRAAVVPLPIGWTVIAQQPTAVALAASRTIRAQSILWILISLAIALTAGLILASGITRPVRALSEGARQLSLGHFDYKVGLESGGELGRLARAFDHMGDEIARRDAEIRAWNEELQKRVDQGTLELREAQEQLVRSESIAAVGTLGAGFAHEINNPLTSILGFSQILIARARRHGGEARDLQALEAVEAEAQRIRSIVEAVLLLSQGYAGEGSAEMDPNTLIDEALQVAGPRTPIEVVRAYTPDLPTVLGDPQQLREALVQLLKNAGSAMREGGRLTLATSHVDRRAVKIEVTDTGVGIAEEHLGKIFEPFYTTKSSWGGRGLGLAVVHSIVQRHLGQIKAASTVGKGTTITITLPVGNRRTHLA